MRLGLLAQRRGAVGQARVDVADAHGAVVGGVGAHERAAAGAAHDPPAAQELDPRLARPAMTGSMEPSAAPMRASSQRASVGSAGSSARVRVMTTSSTSSLRVRMEPLRRPLAGCPPGPGRRHRRWPARRGRSRGCRWPAASMRKLSLARRVMASKVLQAASPLILPAKGSAVTPMPGGTSCRSPLASRYSSSCHFAEQVAGVRRVLGGRQAAGCALRPRARTSDRRRGASGVLERTARVRLMGPLVLGAAAATRDVPRPAPRAGLGQGYWLPTRAKKVAHGRVASHIFGITRHDPGRLAGRSGRPARPVHGVPVGRDGRSGRGCPARA